MTNVIHVDDKWFHIMKEEKTFYLSPTEPKPHRTTESKTFLAKVMFLCAVARPRYNPNTHSIFDGK